MRKEQNKLPSNLNRPTLFICSSHLFSLFMWTYCMRRCRKFAFFQIQRRRASITQQIQRCVSVVVIYKIASLSNSHLSACVCMCSCVNLFFQQPSGWCCADEIIPEAFQWRTSETFSCCGTHSTRPNVYVHENKSKWKSLNTYSKSAVYSPLMRN